jgi:uncharacterized phage protein (TIGR02218 family)
MASITEGPLTSVAFCWRLERADGAGLALTSSDRDLDAQGVRFKAAPGITPAAITRALGLDPDSGDVAGALSADCLTTTDLALGRWDGASVTLAATDWSNPLADSVPLLGGTLGEVSLDDESFSVELRGAASKLQKAPCPSTSAECRAAFGDRQCRIDLAGRSMRATVLSASENVLELDASIDERFLFGRLRYLGGENCGAASVVLAVSGSRISLRDRPRASVAPGVTVELREGCDKRFETCVSRFDNAVNFRGEPHLPGSDLLTRYPGQ